MIAWMDGHEGPLSISVMMSLDVSHDGIHWVPLAHGDLVAGQDLRLPSGETSPAFLAGYVRAGILHWSREPKTGRVYATIASA